MSHPKHYFVYVGAARGEGDPEGIYIFRCNMASGALTPVGEITDIHNPSFLAVHPNGEVLYAINEDRSQAESQANVRAYAIDRQTGALRFINEQPTHGQGLAHISLDHAGRFLFATHYGGGSVTVLPINEEGSVGPASDVVQHAGSGTHPRQQAPHPHSAFVDPSNRFVLVPDLGLDKIMVYRLDAQNGRLLPNDPPWAAVPPESGPRHLAFHPNGQLIYVINELASTITVFHYHAESGRCHAVQTVTTLPTEYTEAAANTTAEILVHPSGRFVYASNRGHDSLAIFAIDEQDGTLSPLGHEPTQGGHPRNFALDPTGTYLYAENRDSNNIVVFRVNPDTGLLRPTGDVVTVPRPVCIKMVAQSA